MLRDRSMFDYNLTRYTAQRFAKNQSCASMADLTVYNTRTYACARFTGGVSDAAVPRTAASGMPCSGEYRGMGRGISVPGVAGRQGGHDGERVDSSVAL